LGLAASTARAQGTYYCNTVFLVPVFDLFGVTQGCANPLADNLDRTSSATVTRPLLAQRFQVVNASVIITGFYAPLSGTPPASLRFLLFRSLVAEDRDCACGQGPEASIRRGSTPTTQAHPAPPPCPTPRWTSHQKS